ncbi:Histidine kinase superfamily protein [Desulfonema limicola]|uniref:Histidine kinase superfamily protein n=1 Tax=Desulfonema limicola TaxID=45656 RepID=A0A975GEI8_9BACT|nr:sensor histidine kinase [Desulfonema limicola]QTA78267.1 Histidine kinase superfamily protein [Desulfonema limicola]
MEFIKNKGRFWVRMDFSVQQITNSNNTRVLCAFNDISRQIETDHELNKYQNELEQLVSQRTFELKKEIEKRKSSEACIAESLKEKEVLLREIHHRVKNNMQVIISLLRLQARKINNKHIAEVFRESQNRVRAMAVIHETLYKQQSLNSINLKEYFTNLAANLIRAYSRAGLIIKPEIETNGLGMDIDRAIPCGLIVNELISNSLKYAFPSKPQGQIRISVQIVEENNIELIVKDNGIGLAEHIDPRNSGTLGLSTVFSLAERQLGAQIKINRDKGTEFSIIFAKDTIEKQTQKMPVTDDRT